jgi:hypothetical protein
MYSKKIIFNLFPPETVIYKKETLYCNATHENTKQAKDMLCSCFHFV